jgi:hypothetical protein
MTQGSKLIAHSSWLKIVDTEQVRPHEVADRGREHRIEKRLQVDGVLRDPLIAGAVRDLEGYVLLDGTNRKQALVALGLPRVLVQVVDYADQHAVQLRTWCHAAAGPRERLLTLAGSIPGLVVSALPPLAAAEALDSATTLAVLLDRRDRYVLTRTADFESSRSEQLRRLVHLYEDSLVRIDCDRDAVEERANALGASGGEHRVLVAFPAFSRSQVVSLAMAGALIPAGITRHVILCGRALRVNLPLELLDGSRTLEEANALLQDHLSGLQPRVYQEPTILFDS